MLKSYFRYLFIVISFLGCYNYAVAQTVQVDARLEKATIPIGDQTKLHLSIRFAAKDSVTFPKLADSIVSKLLILNAAKPDTSFDKNDISIETIDRSYTLTSFDSGQYVIPQYELKTKNGVYKTKELVLQVQPVAVDTSKGVYDIKQPMTVSYSFMEWLRDNWPKVAFPLLAILAVIGLIYYLRKRPKKPGPVKPPGPEKPPHVIALDKLFAMRDEKIWQQGNVKGYYSDISDIMRDYLEQRFQVKAHEKTTDEIFTGIRFTTIADEQRDMLRQILVLADLVKFAKEKPLAQESEQTLNQAIDFVIGTQKVITPTVNNEEKGGDELV